MGAHTRESRGTAADVDPILQSAAIGSPERNAQQRSMLNDSRFPSGRYSTPRCSVAGSLAIAAILVASAACAPSVSGGGSGIVTHPGFDTRIYPGAETMRIWRADSPYRWVGYYLSSPCHRESSWSGRRAEIEQLGWGLAVLYVGQQTFDGMAPPDTAAGTPILCSRTLLTGEQGRRDGQDAVAAAIREGFPTGSVIFLNVERMQTIPDSMRTYYSAWQRELLGDGRYLPGTYAHQVNAAHLHRLAAAAYSEAGRTESPPFWVAGGRDFALDRPAWAIGLPFARIWQGALDVQRTWGGRTLLIDENVATSAAPSAAAMPSPGTPPGMNIQTRQE